MPPDELQPQADAQSVPNQDVTATPAVDVKTPETPETPEQKPPRTFSQEELDAEIGKRLARAQRKWEREQAAKTVPQSTALARDVPPIDEHESPEAYARALAEQLAEQKANERDAEREHRQVLEGHYEREDVAREKYDDYDKIVGNPNLTITQVMADVIRASDTGPDVAYYLGNNPDEAKRIARLPAVLQAKEIGKIEVKVTSQAPVKKTSTTPAPIKPVTSRSSGAPVHDTTDPRSTESMSTSEWIEAERQRQIRKMKSAA